MAFGQFVDPLSNRAERLAVRQKQLGDPTGDSQVRGMLFQALSNAPETFAKGDQIGQARRLRQETMREFDKPFKSVSSRLSGLSEAAGRAGDISKASTLAKASGTSKSQESKEIYSALTNIVPIITSAKDTKSANKFLDAFQETGLGQKALPALKVIADSDQNTFSVDTEEGKKTYELVKDENTGNLAILDVEGSVKKGGRVTTPLEGLVSRSALTETDIERRGAAKLKVAQTSEPVKKNIESSVKVIDSINDSVNSLIRAESLLDSGTGIGQGAASLELASAINRGRPTDKDFQIFIGNKGVINRVKRGFSTIKEGKITDLDEQELRTVIGVSKAMSLLSRNKEYLNQITDENVDVISRKIIPVTGKNYTFNFGSQKEYESYSDIIDRHFKGSLIRVGDSFYEVE